MNKLTLIVFGAALSIGSVFGQAPATGFPPYGSFEEGQFDSVNRQNLNVNFAIPLVNVPGRGIDFAPMLTYDSLIWRKAGNIWAPVVDPNGNPTWGWKAPQILGQSTWVHEMIECGTKPYVSQTWHDYVFTDPQGTTHSFPLAFASNPCGGPTGPRTAPATDDSRYFIDATAPANPVVWDASGRKYTNSTVTDLNGNYISQVVVNSTETDWVDTRGATVLKVIQNASSKDYKYQDTTGSYQTITLNYLPKTIKTNFACAGVVEYTGTTAVDLPSSLTLPNGQTYQFTYEPTPGFSTYTTGRLQRVTLPTGGYIDYGYSSVPGGNSCVDGNPLTLTRVINDGVNSSTWLFTRVANGSAWNTTVRAPQLPYDSVPTETLYMFDSLTRESRRRVFQGAASPFPSGSPIRETITTYSTSQRMWTNQEMMEMGSTTSTVQVVYDSYGLPTRVMEFDMVSHPGHPSERLRPRQTDIVYLRSSPYTSLRILDRATSIIKTDYRYDSLGNLITKIIFRRTITYDGSPLTCVVGALHHDDANYGCAFLVRGNPTSTTGYTDAANATGPITETATYDSLGNLRTADLGCCRQKTWAYSTTNQYAYPEVETRGQSGGPQLATSTTYDTYTGLIASVSDPNAAATSYAYDSMKRLLSVGRPDGAQITYVYTDVGTGSPSVAVTMPIDSTNGRRTNVVLDGLGRAKREVITDRNGTTTHSMIDQEYDPVGHAYRTSNPHLGTPQYWTETRYDASGRPTLLIPPDGTSSTNRISIGYGWASRTETDQTGSQRTYDFDGLGRLTGVSEPYGAYTSYTNDGVDQVKTATQGGQTRTFVYDGLGRLTGRTTPEAGTESYQYNSFDQVTAATDARGVVTTYQYDTLNRLFQVSYNVGTSGAAATPTVVMSYGTNPSIYNKGRLVSVTDGAGQRTFAYDVLGRLTQVSKTFQGVTYNVGYAYNAAGDVTTTQYPSGRTVDQTFDAVGRVRSIAFAGISYVATSTYNAAEQATQFTLGPDIQMNTQYSPQSLYPTALTYTRSGSTLFGLTYGYLHPNGGTNGAITSIGDTVQPGRSVNYGYDLLGRLTSAETAGSASFPKWRLAWTYDQFGNRLSQSAEIGTAPSKSISVSPTTNRITSSGYGYDLAGNLTAVPGATMLVDAENRVTRHSGTQVTDYTYDGSGLRVKKAGPTASTVYVYSGSKLIAEYNGTSAPGSPSREYVYAGRRLIGTYDSTAHFELSDLLSTRASTSSLGSITSESGHYPYGEQWYQTGTSDEQLFTSYERDPESGLDYALARLYSPTIGRFLSTDPVVADNSDPQSQAQYSYVVNDPINSVDPTGTTAVCWFVVTWKVTIIYDASTGQIIAIWRELVGITRHCSNDAPNKRPERVPAIFQPGVTADLFLYHFFSLLVTGQDHFEHCMASCRGARLGPVGMITAGVLGVGKEAWDMQFGGTRTEMWADLGADWTGIIGGITGETSCQQVCDGQRYRAVEPLPRPR
jgi:RHS repeat-associated protein